MTKHWLWQNGKICFFPKNKTWWRLRTGAEKASEPISKSGPNWPQTWHLSFLTLTYFEVWKFYTKNAHIYDKTERTTECYSFGNFLHSFENFTSTMLLALLKNMRYEWPLFVTNGCIHSSICLFVYLLLLVRIVSV